MSNNTQQYMRDMAGGAFIDWITGTSEYYVPEGFEAYAFQPGSDGATIDTVTWLVAGDETIVADGYKSKWVDREITTGPIIFYNPVTSITLSAGDGILACRKSNRQSPIEGSSPTIPAGAQYVVIEGEQTYYKGEKIYTF